MADRPDRCPDCGREWPTDDLKRQCDTGHHATSRIGRPAARQMPPGQIPVTGL